MSQETLDKFSKKFGKDEEPDKTKLTMIDLIFYNPKNNPMPQWVFNCYRGIIAMCVFIQLSYNQYCGTYHVWLTSFKRCEERSISQRLNLRTQHNVSYRVLSVVENPWNLL